MSGTALERLKARRAAGLCQPTAAPARLTAATAHCATDAYLADFDGASKSAQEHEPKQQSTQPSCSSASPAGTIPATLAPRVASAPGGGFAALWVQQLMQHPPTLAAKIELSQRNLLCCSVDWGRQEAVLGSADHAAYAVDLRRRVKGRTLYNKRCGHREWVTAVAHLPGRQVATGGQDAAVWLWDAAPAGRSGNGSGRGGLAVKLEGHAGPVSQLEAVPVQTESAALVSAAYDKRLILWSCPLHGSARAGAVLAGHRAPVLQLRVGAGQVAASGDRDGAVLLWDLQAGAALGKPLSAHSGHCTALEWWGASSGDTAALLLSGGQDGCVRAWDRRLATAPVAQAAAHAGEAGRGAVGSIAAGLPSGAAHLVATAGADCMLRGLDSRRGLATAWMAQLPDFPYCLASTAAAGGTLLLAGCGDGSVVAVDAATGERRWVLAAAASAVRTLQAGDGMLVAGCDDGSVVLWDACDPV